MEFKSVKELRKAIKECSRRQNEGHCPVDSSHGPNGDQQCHPDIDPQEEPEWKTPDNSVSYWTDAAILWN